MKILNRTIAIVLIPLLLAITAPRESFSSPDKVKLSAGTPIILRLTEEASSKTKNTNETVNLEVARDVVVDGKILVKSGTPAIATVTLAEKKGMVGKPGRVQIALEYTKAVDGQRIMLRSTVTQSGKDESTAAIAGGVICCPLFLLMKGKEASLPMGTEVKAYTEVDMTIDAL